MAHLEKYTIAAAGHMCAHYGRQKDENGDYIKFGNKNIDPQKTHLNYNLTPHRDMSEMDYIRTRLQDPDVFMMKREDINVIDDWVITRPGNVQDHEVELFFEESAKFCRKRYGLDESKGEVSAYVHRDEKTDHMHFCFIPLIWNEKKQKYSVSHKKLHPREDYITFHQDLSKHLSQVFGRNIEVLIPEEKLAEKSRDYLPMPELKRQTAAAERLKAQNEKLERQINAKKLVSDFYDTNTSKSISSLQKSVNDIVSNAEKELDKPVPEEPVKLFIEFLRVAPIKAIDQVVNFMKQHIFKHRQNQKDTLHNSMNSTVDDILKGAEARSEEIDRNTLDEPKNAEMDDFERSR